MPFMFVIFMLSSFHAFMFPTSMFLSYHFHTNGNSIFPHSCIHFMHFPVIALSFSCLSLPLFPFMHHSVSTFPLCIFVMISFCHEGIFLFVTMSTFHLHTYHFRTFLCSTISFSTIPPFQSFMFMNIFLHLYTLRMIC